MPLIFWGCRFVGGTHIALLLRKRSGAAESKGGGQFMRHYEVMIILDPDLEEKTIQPSLEAFLNVIRGDGGTVNNVDIWGRRRMAYEINHKGEGIYVVLDLTATPESVAELDRQLNLNEAIVRTKVTRPVVKKAAAKAEEKLGA